MSEHNVFTKKHTEEVTQAKQTLLDELNLPPRATTFIRENKRSLIGVFLLIILSICGRSYYIHYTTTKINQSASAHAKALLVDDSDSRMQALKTVISDHVGTGAAGWATVTLAKEFISAKQYDKAIEALQVQIAQLGAEAPELVLCQLLLAHAYEENGQNDPALSLYQEIGTIHEYMVVATVSVARIYEKMGNKPEAIDAYERVIAAPQLSQPEKDWLKDRIRHLSVT